VGIEFKGLLWVEKEPEGWADPEPISPSGCAGRETSWYFVCAMIGVVLAPCMQEGLRVWHWSERGSKYRAKPIWEDNGSLALHGHFVLSRICSIQVERALP
jgi:hypothetical protein